MVPLCSSWVFRNDGFESPGQLLLRTSHNPNSLDMKARLGLEAGLVWYQPSDFRTPEHQWNLKVTAKKREKH